MDTTQVAEQVAEAEALLRAADRLERVGLIMDSSALSARQRRAIFARQCLSTASADEPEPKRTPIGFPYPNAR
jgi:hypothetical protein